MRNVRSNISFVVLAVIGLIGLFGQAAILHNFLVDSYPFKIMSSPPAEFYATVGAWGYYVSVVGGAAGLALSRSLKPHLTAVVPVILGPLCYWLEFEAAHLVSSFSYEEMASSNFDGHTGYTARYEFGYEAFVLILIGALIAATAGLIITRIFRSKLENLA